MSGQIDNPFEDEAVATATARVHQVLRALLTPKRIAIVLITMIYGAGNVFIPRMLSSSIDFQEMLAFFFVGALATEGWPACSRSSVHKWLNSQDIHLKLNVDGVLMCQLRMGGCTLTLALCRGKQHCFCLGPALARSC